MPRAGHAAALVLAALALQVPAVAGDSAPQEPSAPEDLPAGAIFSPFAGTPAPPPHPVSIAVRDSMRSDFTASMIATALGLVAIGLLIRRSA